MKFSSKPEISVIMSVFNGMPYLKEATKSILTQTYKNFEFIIVDDASGDGTWEYLKKIKDRRVKLIKNKKNIGLASSLNSALSVSKGSFIARMDADDISVPTRLSKQLEFMTKNPQIDICGSWATLIDENGKKKNSVKKPLKDQDIKQMNKMVTGIIHPTWFAKKAVYDKLKGYDPHFDMVEDYDFLIRARNFKMANINSNLLLWRSVVSRRSNESIAKMYEKSLEVRLKYFKNKYFGILFAPLILRSLITTYIFPTWLKIYFNKKAGLI